MPSRLTTKGHSGRGVSTPVPTMRLEALADRLGARFEPIRDSLGGEADLAVVLAHDILGGDDVVLVATRTGVHVRYLWPDEQHTLLGTVRPGCSAWASVRVSPVRSVGWQVTGPHQASLATHTCEVRIGGTAYLVSANGTTGRWAVDGFHDEVVRRGTPWHAPA